MTSSGLLTNFPDATQNAAYLEWLRRCTRAEVRLHTIGEAREPAETRLVDFQQRDPHAGAVLKEEEVMSDVPASTCTRT